MLRSSGAERNRGQFVQVSRLGWPLVNEVVIPLQDKDNYNRTRPVNDLDNYGAYVLYPELPGLLNAVLGAGYATLRLARSTKASQAPGSPYRRQDEGRDRGRELAQLS